MNPNYAAFNGVDFSTISPYLELDRRLANDIPSRDVVLESFARGQGKKNLGAYWREKKLHLLGHVKAPNRAIADQVRDLLLAMLQGSQENLDIVQGGDLRTYHATFSNLMWNNIEGGLVTFDIEFVCGDPFGYETGQTTLVFPGINTAATKDWPINFGGSWFQEPVLALAFSAVSGGTTKTVSIANPATGETISVTRTFAANDTLVLDVPSRAITVNGAYVDYSGVFPSWFTGPGIIRYSDTFTTSRSVTPSGNYVRKWL